MTPLSDTACLNTPIAALQVDLGASALPDQRTFVQEVRISREEAANFLGSSRVPASPEALPGSEQRLQQSFLWTLGLSSCGSWMVKTVEAVALP